MDRIAKKFIKPDRLITPRLILRRLNISDAKDMFEYSSQEIVTKYLLWAPHPDLAYTKRYLKQVDSAYKKGEFYDWGLELKSNRKFIGTCGLAGIDLPNNRGEIGYVLNPDYWGMGLAAEAVRAVIRYCFEELKLNRIEARYMVGNERSRSVMEKCGMHFEGIMRSLLYVKDGYKDIGICSIIAEEYNREKFTNN